MDWDALRLSLLIGVSATALSVLVGLPAAWALARKRFPGRRVVARFERYGYAPPEVR